MAAIPPVVMTGVIVVLKLASPVVYHYMIEVPGGYAIIWRRVGKYLWDCLLDSPLFLLVFGEWMVSDRGSERTDARARWLLAVLLVACPFSAVSRAKIGGWANSMLPGLLAITAFCALRMPKVLAYLERAGTPFKARLLHGSFVATLILMTTFPHFTYTNSPVVRVAPRDDEYWKAVEFARLLPGRVVCPEDPTIPLYAKGYAGQNFFAERDARPTRGNWPTAIPEPTLAEISSADFVVDLTEHSSHINDKLLAGLGFEAFRKGEAPAEPDKKAARREARPTRITQGHLEHYKVWQRMSQGAPVKFTQNSFSRNNAPNRHGTAD